jgi:hypothetical protein
MNLEDEAAGRYLSSSVIEKGNKVCFFLRSWWNITPNSLHFHKIDRMVDVYKGACKQIQL